MPHSTLSTTFMAGFGDLSSLTNMIGPIVTLGMGLVDYVVLWGWFNGLFGAEFLVWSGNLMALLVSLVSAAWVAVKAIDASISVIDGFAFTYRNDSALGSLMGLWEVGFILLWLGWSLLVTIFSFLVAILVIEQLRFRETAVAAEKLGEFGLVLGTNVTFVQGIKFFTLLSVLALGVWISGWTIADVADELLGWFDKYDTSTDNEGRMKKSPFTEDATGTSIIFDVIFHSVTTLYSVFVLNSIMVGGYIFAFIFGWFSGPLTNCDLSKASTDTYTKDGKLFVDGIIPNLNQGTFAECKANMKYMF